MAGIQIHYVRKESQLFPLLEQHDLAVPGKVMWAVHDDIRGQFKTAQELLAGNDRLAARKSLVDLVEAVDDMMQKEERILFSLTLQVFSDKDWRRCRLGEEEIGYAFDVIPGDTWTVDVSEWVYSEPVAGLINLATGQLPPEVIDAMLCNLPFDVSFVDANEKVTYYSDSLHRIFPRSPGVIGRDVQTAILPNHCIWSRRYWRRSKKGNEIKQSFGWSLAGNSSTFNISPCGISKGSIWDALKLGKMQPMSVLCTGSVVCLSGNDIDGHLPSSVDNHAWP